MDSAALDLTRSTKEDKNVQLTMEIEAIKSQLRKIYRKNDLVPSTNKCQDSDYLSGGQEEGIMKRGNTVGF